MATEPDQATASAAGSRIIVSVDPFVQHAPAREMTLTPLFRPAAQLQGSCSTGLRGPELPKVSHDVKFIKGAQGPQRAGANPRLITPLPNFLHSSARRA
jgi:hypothetical protein